MEIMKFIEENDGIDIIVNDKIIRLIYETFLFGE